MIWFFANKNYRLFTIALLLIINNSCVPEKKNPAEPKEDPIEVSSEATKWINKNAHVINSVDDLIGYSDLLPLKNNIGNARIVALGEATYGTHECSRVKLRLLDFLVKEMNFNVVLLGTDYPESQSIENFINTGDGYLDDLLYNVMYWRGGFGPVNALKNNLFWISEEMSEMIAWLYKYNQFKPDDQRLKFYGFGVQRPQKAMLDIIEYVSNIDTLIADYIESKYWRFQNFCWRYPFVSNRIKNDCRARVIAVKDTIDNLRHVFEPITSAEEYEEILFLANYIIRAEDVLRRKDKDTENFYRYEMIKHLIQKSDPNDKFIIWGQNSNIGDYTNSYGNYLKNEYGNDYFTIGFSIHNGYFFGSVFNPEDESHSWPCLLELPEPPQDSYEEYFITSDYSNYYLDLHSNLEPEGSEATDWLRTPKEFNSIEFFYEPDDPNKYFHMTNLRHIFDLIIFISTTTQSDLFIY